MYDFSIAFGKRVRELREQRGISQQRLSELLNISRPAISQIERGGEKNFCRGTEGTIRNIPYPSG